jgi:hypothetical protein
MVEGKKIRAKNNAQQQNTKKKNKRQQAAPVEEQKTSAHGKDEVHNRIHRLLLL